MPNTDLGNALLSAARHALDRAFGHRSVALPRHDALEMPGATFVTLTQQGELRGCVGTLEARWSLQRDVKRNALAAAFQDPRFAPLREGELAYTRIEVSLLSSPVPLSFVDEDDLLQRLQPGVDGVVLEWRGRRATFLPQVWDSLSDPREFIAALKDKAGVTEKFWHDAMRVSRYAVDKWKEADAQS
jgi:AmmeMemoRadiSam system protein A